MKESNSPMTKTNHILLYFCKIENQEHWNTHRIYVLFSYGLNLIQIHQMADAEENNILQFWCYGIDQNKSNDSWGQKPNMKKPLSVRGYFNIFYFQHFHEAFGC